MKIDFANIQPHGSSQADSFEKLVVQLARNHSEAQRMGGEFVPIHGAGGDGGVECYWEFEDGTKWGWQAKFVFEYTAAYTQLNKSLETAIAVHPELTRYYMCIPIDLTAQTAREGKSKREYFEDHRDEWIEAAAKGGVELDIMIWGDSDLQDELLKIDSHGGRRLYWFHENVATEEQFASMLESSILAAGPRYSPEIHVELPIRSCFESLCETEEFKRNFEDHLSYIADTLAQFASGVRSQSDSPSHEIAFPAEKFGQARSLCDEFASLVADFEFGEVTEFVTALQPHLRGFNELLEDLEQIFESEHGAGKANSERYRQWRAEYQCDFPHIHLDRLKDVVEDLVELVNWLRESNVDAYGASTVLISGSAGSGKTHLLCDIAQDRAKRGLKTVLLFGQQISSQRTFWDQLRERLGLPATVGEQAVWEWLNTVGEVDCEPVLILVDALNETSERGYWKRELGGIASRVKSFEWLRLGCSYRSSYASRVLPEQLVAVEFKHTGFKEGTANVCDQIFEFYGLGAPEFAILPPEFSNPLFVKLACETALRLGLRRIPLDWAGFSQLTKAYLQSLDEKFANNTDTHRNHCVPSRVLTALIAAMSVQDDGVKWEDAVQIVAENTPKIADHFDILNWLLCENAVWEDIGPEDELMLRFAFQRLTQQIFVNHQLNQISAPAELFSLAPFQMVFGTSDDLLNSQGVVEALVLALPEEHGVELFSICPPQYCEAIEELTLALLATRTPASLREETVDLVERYFIHELQHVLEPLIEVALSPSMLDARFLSQKLKQEPMAERDGFWCLFLHRSFHERGTVFRLLTGTGKPRINRLTPESAELWLVLLGWFFVANDRRVRDHATMISTHIAEAFPDIVPAWIQHFIGVDDDYVLERVLLASYGALLRTRSPHNTHEAAKLLKQHIFDQPIRVPNVAIRDYALGMIELAVHLPLEGVASVQVPTIPMTSHWPLTIPTVEKPPQDNPALWRLWRSCTFDDFFVYGLSCVEEFDGSPSQGDAAYWIYDHVVNAIGYHSTARRFDVEFMNRYGVGRGRHVWAERIGKKYQRIARNRLMAHVSDNCQCDGEYIVFRGGRDLDPSRRSRRKGVSPRLITNTMYEVPESAQADWESQIADMPEFEDVVFDDGWVILLQHLKRRPIGFPDSNLIWAQIRGYLVPKEYYDEWFQWLSDKNLIGRWMPEGGEVHSGFIGEYPWNSVFASQHSSEWYVSQHKDHPPHPMVPAGCEIHSSYEADSYHDDSVSFMAPANNFFHDGALRSNGDGGFYDGDTLVFEDPSCTSDSPSALRANRDWMTAYLNDHAMSLIITVLASKQSQRYSRRLAFSQVFGLHENTVERSHGVSLVAFERKEFECENGACVIPTNIPKPSFNPEFKWVLDEESDAELLTE